MSTLGRMPKTDAGGTFTAKPWWRGRQPLNEPPIGEKVYVAYDFGGAFGGCGAIWLAGHPDDRKR